MTVKRPTLTEVFPYILIIGAAISLLASFILTYDTLKISSNPHYAPSCSLNPIISCGTVINAANDTIFGLPYPYYGVAAFAVLLTIGVSLLAGAQFKRWFWQGLQGGAVLGFLGSYWLLFKSVHIIHALCPFCLIVDICTTTIVWYATLYTIDQGHIKLPKGKASDAYAWARKNHLGVLILWFVIISGLVLKHFWYYYGRNLHF